MAIFMLTAFLKDLCKEVKSYFYDTISEYSSLTVQFAGKIHTLQSFFTNYFNLDSADVFMYFFIFMEAVCLFTFNQFGTKSLYIKKQCDFNI